MGYSLRVFKTVVDFKGLLLLLYEVLSEIDGNILGNILGDDFTVFDGETLDHEYD